jgi:hypothetical protein
MVDLDGIPDEAVENCEEIASLLGHKKCLYEFFTIYLKKLLPDASFCDLKFLLQIISGDKKCID